MKVQYLGRSAGAMALQVNVLDTTNHTNHELTFRADPYGNMVCDLEGHPEEKYICKYFQHERFKEGFRVVTDVDKSTTLAAKFRRVTNQDLAVSIRQIRDTDVLSELATSFFDSGDSAKAGIVANWIGEVEEQDANIKAVIDKRNKKKNGKPKPAETAELDSTLSDEDHAVIALAAEALENDVDGSLRNSRGNIDKKALEQVLDVAISPRVIEHLKLQFAKN